MSLKVHDSVHTIGQVIQTEQEQLSDQNWDTMKEALGVVRKRYENYIYTLEKRPKL